MNWLGHIYLRACDGNIENELVGACGAVSPTGYNSEKGRVGTMNVESELAGAYFPDACQGNLESELDGAYSACKPHRMQF